jgi:hypothetical protein
VVVIMVAGYAKVMIMVVGYANNGRPVCKAEVTDSYPPSAGQTRPPLAETVTAGVDLVLDGASAAPAPSASRTSRPGQAGRESGQGSDNVRGGRNGARRLGPGTAVRAAAGLEHSSWSERVLASPLLPPGTVRRRRP